MTTVEPTLATYANPFVRYFAATRPAFLGVTLIGGLLGLASAFADGVALDALTGFVTLVAALVAHAGINVLNDYYDALNGSDAANTERRYPFTGGSRFIQNGIISVRTMGRYGYALLAAVVPAGLWLAYRSGPELIWIGVAGLAIGWAYSAPPLKLMSRGFGEVAVACGWLLVVLGTDYVQRGALSWGPFVAGFGYALLIVNLLFINQFPDVKADAAARKRNLVVRLGPRRARWLYPANASLAYLWLVGAVFAGALPPLVLVGLASAIPALGAARALAREALNPAGLEPAIRATIGAALLHGALLTAALFAAG